MSLEAGEKNMTPAEQEALIARMFAQQQPFFNLVTNQLGALEKRFTSVDGQMQSMTRSLNRLEDHDLLSKVNGLETRLNALELEQHQRQGAMKAAEWVPKWLGWLAAGVLFAVNWVINGKG